MEIVAVAEPSTPPGPEAFEDLSEKEAIALMKQWFFENFEDPANDTPYEGKEGGYIYVWGGPYSAMEELYDAFDGTVADELIEKATHEIEAYGFDWVASANRFFYAEDEPDEEAEETQSPHQHLLEKVADLEKKLDRLESAWGKIGHNNPPSNIDEATYTVADAKQLRIAITIIQSQPESLPAVTDEVKTATDIIQKQENRLAAYVKKLADTFVMSATAEAGKKSVQLAAWTYMASLVMDLFKSVQATAAALAQWIKIINLPF
jgi:hypothetical protein